MKATMRSGSRTPSPPSAPRDRAAQQHLNEIGEQVSLGPDHNVRILYARQESADQGVTFDSLGVPASNTNDAPASNVPPSSSRDPRRTNSTSSRSSLKSVASALKVGIQKLSSTLKPRNGDPPSDYQRFAGMRSPGEEKRGDYFTDKVTDRIAKGMHGEFDKERKEIALKLLTQQKEQEHEERMERKRAERRQKQAEKETRQNEPIKGKEQEKEGEEDRSPKVRKGRLSIDLQALFQMRLADLRQKDRMDREGWAGFNEDGTLRPKSGLDPGLEARFRKAAKAQGKEYRLEDEFRTDSDEASSDAVTSSTQRTPGNGTPEKAQRSAASAAAEYFSHRSKSGRFQSPAKKTATEAFGPSKSLSPPRNASPDRNAAGNRETSFSEMIARAKGEAPGVPQIPWTAKLQQKPGEWTHKVSRSLDKIGKDKSTESDMDFTCAGAPLGINAGQGRRCIDCGIETLDNDSPWEVCRDCRRK